jgi:uncharacterized phage infection (PIP) family protein YhgE
VRHRFTIRKNIGIVRVIKIGGSLMEETLKEILSELQKTNGRLGNLETGQTELGQGQKEVINRTENLEIVQTVLVEGQKELNTRTKGLEEGVHELNTRTKRLEEGQKDLNNYTKKLEEGQKELIAGQNQLSTRMENVEKGQDEIKDLIKHTTTLLTDNFTYIRKDMKTFANDVNADVELLFKEVGGVKRKVNKLEQKL